MQRKLEEPIQVTSKVTLDSIRKDASYFREGLEKFMEEYITKSEGTYESLSHRNALINSLGSAFLVLLFFIMIAIIFRFAVAEEQVKMENKIKAPKTLFSVSFNRITYFYNCLIFSDFIIYLAFLNAAVPWC